MKQKKNINWWVVGILLFIATWVGVIIYYTFFK